MILELKGIINGGSGSLEIDTSLDFSDVEYFGERLFPNPVHVKGVVKNQADVTELRLLCTVTVEKPCDRCGKMTVSTLEVPLNRILVTEMAGEDNEAYVVVANDQLDLYELCLSEVLLELPMKYLCRSDCKGVCVQCGKNLNEGSCECPKKSIDPRLEALAKLLEEQE